MIKYPKTTSTQEVVYIIYLAFELEIIKKASTHPSL